MYFKLLFSSRYFLILTLSSSFADSLPFTCSLSIVSVSSSTLGFFILDSKDSSVSGSISKTSASLLPVSEEQFTISKFRYLAAIGFRDLKSEY